MLRAFAILLLAALVAAGLAFAVEAYRPRAAVNYTIFLVQEGRRDEALAHARRAQARFPRERRLTESIAALLLAEGEAAEARQQLNRLGDGGPGILRDLCSFYAEQPLDGLDSTLSPQPPVPSHLFLDALDPVDLVAMLRAWRDSDLRAALAAARRIGPQPAESPAGRAVQIVHAVTAFERGAIDEAGAVLDALAASGEPIRHSRLQHAMEAHLISTGRSDLLAYWRHRIEPAESVAALKTIVAVTKAGPASPPVQALPSGARPLLDESSSSEGGSCTFAPSDSGSVRPAGEEYPAAVWNQFRAGSLQIETEKAASAPGAEVNDLLLVACGDRVEGEWPVVALLVNGRRSSTFYVDSAEPRLFRRRLEIPTEELARIELQFINNAISSEAAERGDDRNVYYFAAAILPLLDPKAMEFDDAEKGTGEAPGAVVIKNSQSVNESVHDGHN